MHGMPLSYLSGDIPLYRHWGCVNLEKDLCYFGIRSYEEREIEMVRNNNVLVFDSVKDCHIDKLDSIHSDIHAYFFHK